MCSYVIKGNGYGLLGIYGPTRLWPAVNLSRNGRVEFVVEDRSKPIWYNVVLSLSFQKGLILNEVSPFFAIYYNSIKGLGRY